MRARWALLEAGVLVQWREIELRAKPVAMLEASAKGTVPVLVLADGTVIEESLELMHWALAQADPRDCLGAGDLDPWVGENDGVFKHHLDRFKYSDRYPEADRSTHQQEGRAILKGWNDPRMPTLSGMRRRGYPAEAIRNFCATVGITKVPSTSDIALLEHSVREVLNRTAVRRMAVLDPLEVELTNWPEGETLEVEAVNNPEDAAAGTRKVPFTARLYIEQADFREAANRKFFRLKLGGEVRLRGAYIVKCEEVVKDEAGKIIKLLCRVDLDTLNRNPEDRKVKGVIHWVSAKHALRLPVRMFDRLFSEEKPDADRDRDFLDFVNPQSMDQTIVYGEPSLAELSPGQTCQFERVGYFCADTEDSQTGEPTMNQTVGLRDTRAGKAGK